jgi:hypothetical protein
MTRRSVEAFGGRSHLTVVPTDSNKRIPPHNIDAEQALLGAILVNNDAFSRVADFLKPEHFSEALHQRIYGLASEMIREGKIANPVTLKTFLAEQDVGQGVTSSQYLARLAAEATTIINAEDYGRTVHDLSVRRDLIVLGEEIVNTAYDAPIDASPQKLKAAAIENLQAIEPAAKGELKNLTQFVAQYAPPAYIADPIIESGKFYTGTAPTGHGKTGLAVATTLAVATGRGELIGMEVTQGRVAYLAFENPDDVLTRFGIAAWTHNIDLGQLGNQVRVLDKLCTPEAAYETLRVDAKANGPFTLIFADTYGAWFMLVGKEINENVEAGRFARRIRPLIDLPGRPAVVVLAHPVKRAGKDNLVPYGAGSVLNEVDGNLTLWSSDGGATAELHWQGKLRGVDFAPRQFRTELCCSPDFLDKRGRQRTLPVIMPTTAEAVSDRKAERAQKDIDILRAIAASPSGSQREWAQSSGASLAMVSRRLETFERSKLVERTLSGRYELTEKGRKALAKEG